MDSQPSGLVDLEWQRMELKVTYGLAEAEGAAK